MIPVLITGGTAEERLGKAIEVGMGKWEVRNVSGNEGEKWGKEKQNTHSHLSLPNSLLASHPDFLFLDSPTTIGINEIRDLQKRLSLKPHGPGPKIALINNAQNLTIEAQNAFLKTLEEPPKNSQIILTALTVENLLPTVVSRCQIIKLAPKPQISLTEKEISQFLNFLISLAHSSMGERLKKIEPLGLAQDRQKAIKWVDKMIILGRELILTNHFPKSRLKAVKLLKSLSKTKKYFEANVNIRLALDNFLLDLPKI